MSFPLTPPQQPPVQQMNPAIQQAMQTAVQRTQGPNTPPGVPIPRGVDDYSLNMGFSPDAQNEYTDVKPIDKDGIKGLNDETLQQLGNDLRNLVWQGVIDRRTGGRDGNVEEFRSIFEMEEPSEGGPWENACRIVSPDTRGTVETISARRVKAVIDTRERVKVETPYPEEGDTCLKLGKFATKYFDTVGSIKILLADLDRTACVDGSAVIHTYWKRETDKRRKRVQINDAFLQEAEVAPPDPKYVLALQEVGKVPIVTVKGKNYLYNSMHIVENEEEINDHFCVEAINIRDFFMYPASSICIETATVAGFYFTETPNDARLKAQNGYYDQKAVDFCYGNDPTYNSGIPDAYGASNPIGVGDESSVSNNSLEQMASDEIGRSFELSDRRFGRRKVLKCWAKIYDADRDGVYEELEIIMEWSTRRILRITRPTDFKEIRPLYLYSPEHRIGYGAYGYSLVEKLRGLQAEVDALTRMGIDSGTLANSKIIQEEAGRNSLDDNVFTPGVTIRNIGVDGEIKNILGFEDTSASNFVNRKDVRAMIQAVSGADEVTQGTSTNQDSTLGQTNIAVAAGNIRQAIALYNMMDMMTWLYNRFFDSLIQNLEDDADKIVYNGKPFVTDVNTNDIAICEHAIITAHCDLIDNDTVLKLQMSEKWFTALMKSPFVSEDLVRVGRVLTDYLNDTEYNRDISFRIGTEQDWEQQQEIQQQMQAMQAKLAAAQGMPPGQQPDSGIPENQSPAGGQ